MNNENKTPELFKAGEEKKEGQTQAEKLAELLKNIEMLSQPGHMGDTRQSINSLALNAIEYLNAITQATAKVRRDAIEECIRIAKVHTLGMDYERVKRLVEKLQALLPEPTEKGGA